MGIANVTTTVKNPQANSIIERMHLSFGQILRSVLAELKLSNNEQHSDLLNSFVSQRSPLRFTPSIAQFIQRLTFPPCCLSFPTRYDLTNPIYHELGNHRIEETTARAAQKLP